MASAPGKPHRWKRWLLLRLRSILFIYAMFLSALYALQRSMLFPRHLLHAPTPNIESRVPGLSRLTIDTDEGQQRAWLLPGDGVSADRPGPAVIFAHGNGELAEDWLIALGAYRRLGVTVLIPEYRGYAGMPGSPSQETLTSDFVRFYDLLATRPEVDSKRIVIHGRSVGGGVACALAAERKPAALILQSTFSSVTVMARRYFAPSFLVRDRFDNASVLTSLRIPIFIAHGKRDRLIPYSHALELQKRAPHATFVTYDADHNDCPPDWNEYFARVAAFLRQAGVLHASAALP